MVPMLSYVSNGIVCVQCRVVTLTPTNVVSMKHLSSFPVAKFTGMVQLAMWWGRLLLYHEVESSILIKSPCKVTTCNNIICCIVPLQLPQLDTSWKNCLCMQRTSTALHEGSTITTSQYTVWTNLKGDYKLYNVPFWWWYQCNQQSTEKWFLLRLSALNSRTLSSHQSQEWSCLERRPSGEL